ncbi:MAG TPA: hypothetical protein VLA72_12560 [Anaerolineales bacterium]|nr:hypothetical protein [Anaerolineales bacterium]
MNKADPVDELLEPMEVVAVFSTLIAKHGVSHAVHLMTKLSHRGWDNYFNEDFFGLILPTSRELRWVGLKND